jgi:alkanesulfonate monooxygenase SsuD/methylene tetrahydromethanopterin reductase-like flavin-dependent oxidoreductase (luciferase family)
VLILPYREPLATAKQVATLQELSGNRLLLGVGIGWMDAEFRVLGLDRGRRGRDADERLAFLHRCFDNELVEANGQPFLFKPRPPRPPLLIGGRAPHALERAVRYGDGWLPMGGDPQRLAADLETYVRIASAHGRERGSVTVMRPLPGEDPEACRALLAEYAELGVERVVAAIRYDNIEEYLTALERLASLLPS